jgi:D-alanine-D-alanine ligase
MMREDFRKKRIGVLMGGLSVEREISLRTGGGVHGALERLGYDAVPVDWREGTDPSALLRAEKVEVVWNALHGTYGEDGCVQGLLESLHLPYTGSGVLASALAMEKVQSKRIFERAGIPTPAWSLLAPGSDPRPLAEKHGYPVVIKPSREGSTVGVSIVREVEGLEEAVRQAEGRHGSTMVETYIAGREVSVPVLDDRALGTVEIRPGKGFYDYEAKYLSGDTEYLVPAPFQAAVHERIMELAARSHGVLGCSEYSRVDLRVPEKGEPSVLEVNTLPGLTETSLFPKVARHAGIDYDTLVERILGSAGLRS